MKDFICLACPNGCHLATRVMAGAALEVIGNRCDKGLAFARQVLANEGLKRVGRIVSGDRKTAHPPETLKGIAALWGVSFKAVKPHLTPQGSPERTEFRAVIEDEEEDLFILEEIAPASYHAKLRIIRTIEFLAEKGLDKVVAYRLGIDGQHIQSHGDGLWQMVAFMPGLSLDREHYLYEGWRAGVLSDFLIRMKDAAKDIPFFSLDKPFSIKAYIYTLFHRIEQRRPELVAPVKKVLDFLEKGLLPSLDRIPARFCHGDYHPLNIIWGKDRMEAVIDWEFCGVKPELYDVANMIGCLGIEHPSSLLGDLVVNFVAKLRKDGFLCETSWDVILEFVIALRFAWLSEWLRKGDEEMIIMELDYMELLINNRNKVRDIWGLERTKV